MSQFLRPEADITTTGIAGGTYAAIDETSAVDTPAGTEFVYGTEDVAVTYEVRLSDAIDPGVHTGHIFRYRIVSLNDTTPSTSAVVYCTASLYQGTTLIKADTQKTTTATWTTYSLTLSEAEAGNITNYTDLRLRFVSAASGGSAAARRALGISWAEMEVPDSSMVTGTCGISNSLTQSFNSSLIIPSAVNAQANVSQGFSPNLSIDSITNFGSYNLLNLLSLANVLSEIGIDGRNLNEMNVLLGLISNVGLIQNNYLSLIPSNYINSNTVFALQNLLNLDSNNVVNSNLSTLLSTYLTLSSDATRILLGELNISLLNNLLLNSNNVIKSIFETSLYGILNENSINLIQSLLVSESEIILSLMAKDTINASLNTALLSYLTLITEIQSIHYGEINIVSLNNFLLNSNNIIKSIFEILLHEELDQNSINLIQSLLISESETMLSLVSKNIVNAIFENQLLNLIDGTSVLLILSNIDLVTALNTYFRSGDFEPALITASLESLLNMQQSFSSLNEILGESSLINSLGIIVNAINNIKAFSSMLNSIEVILDSKKEIYATNSIQSFLLNDINGKNIEISHINLSGNLYNVSNALINILSNIEISNEEDLQLNSKLIIGATQLLYGLGIIEPIGRSGIFQTVPTPDQRTYAIIENKNTLIIIDKEGRIFSIPIQNRKLFFPKE